MKLNNSFFYTLREDVKDEESRSSNLLIRGGFIKKSSTGVFMILPLGLKVLNKIETIIREEMNNIGSQELLMPVLIPEDVYIESGRRDNFGNDMFTLKDRFNKSYVLGPTHEELFGIASQMKIKSYKDLPVSLYQLQTKFRDEPRPRYGLIRVREFIMKDAYTFDTSLEGLDKSYQSMYDAYKNIFDRIGFEYKIVTADTGVMGGLLSEEFQAVTKIGEDTLVLCDNCEYASNIEITPVINQNVITNETKKTIEKVHTPNVKTIEDVANFLDVNSSKLVKTLIYNIDNKLYACLVPGNREINETKLKKLVNGLEIRLAFDNEVKMIIDAPIGFLGPVNLNMTIIMDEAISHLTNFITGANQTDHHYLNTNIEDFKVDITADISTVQENDYCPKCNGKLYFTKGIEIGNTFKLGTKYAEAMNLKYLDNNNKLQPLVMGSYGIGVGRIMAAIVEQNNDDKGIIWPMSIAPYQVEIIIVNLKDENAFNYANELYNELRTNNIDCLLDDRNERAGVKFNDADLIGIPIRITIGRSLVDGIVEVKHRNQELIEQIKTTDLINYLKEYIS